MQVIDKSEWCFSLSLSLSLSFFRSLSLSMCIRLFVCRVCRRVCLRPLVTGPCARAGANQWRPRAFATAIKNRLACAPPDRQQDYELVVAESFAKEAEDEARAVAAQQVAQQLHLERENMFKKQAL